MNALEFISQFAFWGAIIFFSVIMGRYVYIYMTAPKVKITRKDNKQSVIVDRKLKKEEDFRKVYELLK